MAKIVDVPVDPVAFYLYLLERADEAWNALTEEQQQSIENNVRGREFEVNDVIASITTAGANGRRRHEIDPPLSVHKIVVFPHVAGDQV